MTDVKIDTTAKTVIVISNKAGKLKVADLDRVIELDVTDAFADVKRGDELKVAEGLLVKPVKVSANVPGKTKRNPPRSALNDIA